MKIHRPFRCSLVALVVSAASVVAHAQAPTITTPPAPVGTAPTITTQPASLVFTAGGNATISVVATGTAPLGFRWHKNGRSISNATAASLTLAPGVYSVHVTGVRNQTGIALAEVFEVR